MLAKVGLLLLLCISFATGDKPLVPDGDNVTSEALVNDISEPAVATTTTEDIDDVLVVSTHALVGLVKREWLEKLTCQVQVLWPELPAKLTNKTSSSPLVLASSNMAGVSLLMLARNYVPVEGMIRRKLLGFLKTILPTEMMKWMTGYCVRGDLPSYMMMMSPTILIMQMMMRMMMMMMMMMI
uniref:Uncharacterized protein n=1 Tax=Romanomermis culicivorax TaxID=13658 RepID=A0A915KMI7_ROMCU